MKLDTVKISKAILLLDTILPFTEEVNIISYLNGKVAPPIQKLLDIHGITISKRYDNTIEDRHPDRETAGYLYNFMFPNEEHFKSGEVLFIKLVERMGIIFEAKNLKEFFLDGHFKVFQEYFDTGFEDYYFLFLELNTIYVYEHPGVTYSFITCIHLSLI